MLKLKEDINLRLKNLDFNRIKELLLWLAESEDYQRLKYKDEQLSRLDFFGKIWLQEKKHQDALRMQGDIFARIESLEDIDRKYNVAKFAAMRIENDLPEELCADIISEMLEYRFSAYAMFLIIVNETIKRTNNVLGIARMLKAENKMLMAIGLLEQETEMNNADDVVLLEMADCWLEMQQYAKAYECLKKMAVPGEDIETMIAELEQVIENEGI